MIASVELKTIATVSAHVKSKLQQLLLGESKQLCNCRSHPLFAGSSKKIGGLRVVNVVGFKRAYGFLNEILALAKPFGTVVQHLVLDVRPEVKLVG